MPTFAAANVDGNTVDPDTILVVINGGVGSINVTLQTPVTVRGRAVADDVIAVAAGATKWIKLTDRALVRTSAPDADKIYVDYSGVTSVTVGAFLP